ncbi:radical SAM protein [Desulfonatronovibrio magnus]|uniref:radical SAM protein n=1 Tax=Desulfonatronovibrio magnus TaxID=698827 RepID=UPI0005EB6EDE|nr:radical SAM protein [Desulfonatronovibrio magnus]
MNFKTIFGPVRSSRLGNSLGIDLVCDKICSFDCLYCESGKTRTLTTSRAPLVSSDLIIQELSRWLELHSVLPDCVTLGGEGEPCLNSELGKIIKSIKILCPEIPIAVLTNSSLLGNSSVRSELSGADIVLPSLDSLVEEEFQRINRPHSEVSLHGIKQGLLQFSREFKGKFFLEVLILPGFNDSLENQNLIREFLQELRPDRVDVTTMTRPGAYLRSKLPDPAFLKQWQQKLHPQHTGGAHGRSEFQTNITTASQTILASLQRRPQTTEQLALALGLSREQAQPVIDEMIKSGKIKLLTGASAGPNFYVTV